VCLFDWSTLLPLTTPCSYTPPNYNTDPPSEFATGIHHPYGTQVMILHSQRRGVGHDTTYRNMNENRAPLTIMITVDEDSRMVPGTCLLPFRFSSHLIPSQVLLTCLQVSRSQRKPNFSAKPNVLLKRWLEISLTVSQVYHFPRN
jgi:hypothetical protein